jgi:hypothetical protein
LSVEIGEAIIVAVVCQGDVSGVERFFARLVPVRS